MELVYLWVEDYKNIKKQGFNFSPRFKCKYDKDSNELTIDENENYISIFPENVNVTAIVGENGSGKSSLLETIYYSFVRKILISVLDNQIKIHTSLENLQVCNGTTKLHIVTKGRVPQVHFSWDILHYEPVMDIVDYGNPNPNILLNLVGTFKHPSYMDLIAFNNSSIIKYVEIYIKHKTKIFSFNPNKISIGLSMKRDNDKWNYKKIKEEIEHLKFPEKESQSMKEKYFKTINLYVEKYLNEGDYRKEFSLEEYKLLINEFEYMKEILSKIPSFSIDMYDNDISFFKLSHGERSILLSNTLIYEKSITQKKRGILVCLDEPDLSLHPQWQKKYVNELINTFSLVKMNIHFLITSHSPFILSDLPKENVIFLEDGVQKYPFKEKQTFGANIHTLLSDGFFMEDGLMGEFAKGKIEEIKKFYDFVEKFKNRIDLEKKIKKRIEKYYLNRKENFNHIQSIIGEPFLKTIMKNYLDELEIYFIGKNQFLDKEIERLQALKDK